MTKFFVSNINSSVTNVYQSFSTNKTSKQCPVLVFEQVKI